MPAQAVRFSTRGLAEDQRSARWEDWNRTALVGLHCRTPDGHGLQGERGHAGARRSHGGPRAGRAAPDRPDGRDDRRRPHARERGLRRPARHDDVHRRRRARGWWAPATSWWPTPTGRSAVTSRPPSPSSPSSFPRTAGTGRPAAGCPARAPAADSPRCACAPWDVSSPAPADRSDPTTAEALGTGRARPRHRPHDRRVQRRPARPRPGADRAEPLRPAPVGGSPWPRRCSSVSGSCRGSSRPRSTSFPRYLTDRRLRRAVELLAATPAPAIGEIATRCGFSSAAYFSRVFRDHLGVAPSGSVPAESASYADGCIFRPSNRPGPAPRCTVGATAPTDGEDPRGSVR